MFSKNYTKMTDSQLDLEEKYLKEDIAEHERNLARYNSLIITLSTRFALKVCREELHKVQAEKCFRQLNNK